MTQNKARRTNKIDFLQLPWAQEVSGSNPDAPTKIFWSYCVSGRSSPASNAWPNSGSPKHKEATSCKMFDVRSLDYAELRAATVLKSLLFGEHLPPKQAG
jgi:hypothetical protein